MHKVIVYLKRLCIFALESTHCNSYCFDKIDFININNINIMKKLFLLPLCIIAMLMASCTSVDDNPTPDPIVPDEPQPTAKADYTILMYGMGGGDIEGGGELDPGIVCMNIKQLFEGKKNAGDNINVVVNYKFSPVLDDEKFSIANLEGEMEIDDEKLPLAEFAGKSYRFAIEDDKTMFNTFVDENLYGKQENDMANPDSLTNFINWAAKNYPAEKYVLVLTDHGGGYTVDEDLPFNNTRGLLYDSAGKNYFTVNSLRHALENANQRMDVLYYDACLMNTVEYQFELKDLTDYIMASTYVVPGEGGQFSELIDLLDGPNDLESALKMYAEALVNHWDNNGEGAFIDFSVTKTSMLNQYGAILKEFTDKLITAYQCGDPQVKEAIDRVTTTKAFRVDDSTAGYDIGDYVAAMCDEEEGLPDKFGPDFLARYLDSYKKCVIATYTSAELDEQNYEVDYSITLGAQGAFAITSFTGYDDGEAIVSIYRPDGAIWYYQGEYKGNALDFDVNPWISQDKYQGGSYWNSTFANTYEQLKFDQIVGWSRWLKINEKFPLQYPAPTHYLTMGGDEGGDEGDDEGDDEGGDYEY